MVVEPAEPFEGYIFHSLEAAPRAAAMDDFGPHARLTDLLDPFRHGSLIGAAGLVVERRAVESSGLTSLSD